MKRLEVRRLLQPHNLNLQPGDTIVAALPDGKGGFLVFSERGAVYHIEEEQTDEV